jgi:predicted phage terminase large subunit-like protein
MKGGIRRLKARAVAVNVTTPRPRRAPWLNDFQKEAMAFPAAKYDDQVDALSQALDRAFLRRPTMRCGAIKGLY